MRLLQKNRFARVLLLMLGVWLLSPISAARAQNFFSFGLSSVTPSNNITPGITFNSGAVTIDLGTINLSSLPIGATLELFGTVFNSSSSDNTLVLSNFSTDAPSLFAGSGGGFYSFLGSTLAPGSSQQIDIGSLDVTTWLQSIPADDAQHSLSFSFTLSGDIADAGGNDTGNPFGPDITPGPPSVTIRAIVHATPPTTTITGGPANGTTVTTNSVTFTFTGTDAVTPTAQLTYQYRVDGGTVVGPISNTSVTLTGLADGSHTFTVAAINGANKVDPNPPTTGFTVDTLSPTVSNVQAVQIGDAHAGITWTSNKPTSSQVQYRIVGTVNWNVTPLMPTLVTSHGVPLTGLQPNQPYEYQVFSTDSSGRMASSAVLNFNTLPDTTPPQAAITGGPANGGAVRPGPVIFTWTGVDDATPTPLLQYQYQVNGGAWSSISSATSVTLNESLDGPYMFAVRALDASGNISQPATTNFTVDSTLPGFSAQPTFTNITFNGVTVNWATTKSTTGSVQFQVGGGDFLTYAVDSIPNQSHSLSIGSLAANTAYNVRVIAVDNVGNQVVSTPVVTFTTAPVHDLGLGPADISYSDPGPASGENITMTAQIHNLGDYDQSATVVFHDVTMLGGDQIIGSKSVTVAAHAANPIPVTSPGFTVLQGLHQPYVQLTNITPNNDITTNTTAERDLIVGAPACQLTAAVYNPKTWPGNNGLFTVLVKNTGSRAQTLQNVGVSGVPWVTLSSALPTDPLQPGDEAQLTFSMNTPSTLVGGPFNNPVLLPMTFTVSCGQTFTTNFAVEAYSQPLKGVNVTVLDASTHNPIPNATVCMDNTDQQWVTDNNGIPVDPTTGLETQLYIVPGATNIYAIGANYLPASVNADGSAPVTLNLTPGKALEVTGVTTRQLSLAEIQARGVNLQDPNNFFVFDFVVALKIGPLPVNNVVLPAHPVAGGTYYIPIGGGGGAHGCVGGLFVYYPTSDPTIHTDVWIIIPGDIRILKQFWDATVFVKNNSNFPINNVTATLSVPTGLSLPLLFNQPQQVTQSLGTIDPMSQKQADWTVRGDRPGTYVLTGIANGVIQLGGSGVPLVASLNSAPLTVAEPRLGVSFNTPKVVYAGQPFQFGVNVTDESTIDWQLVEVALHANKLVNCHLAPGQSPLLDLGMIKIGQTKTATFTLISEVTGVVLEVDSYVSPGPVEPPVTVVQTAYPPPIAVDDAATTNYNTPVNINVLANDSDPSGHTISVQSVSQGSNGSVAINPDGTVKYSPQAGFAGVDQFLYTITNGQAGIATAKVTVTVNAPTPTLALLSPATATAGGGSVTLTLTGTNFITSSVAQASGTNLTTTYVSPTKLTAVLPTSMTATAGTLNITVVNPNPGGSSGAQTFTVNGTPHLALSAATATRNAGGSVTINYTILNNGTAAAPQVKVTQARLSGSATVNTSNGPTDVSAGGTLSGSVTIPAPVTSGAHTLSIYGTLNGVAFSLSHSINVP